MMRSFFPEANVFVMVLIGIFPLLFTIRLIRSQLGKYDKTLKIQRVELLCNMLLKLKAFGRKSGIYSYLNCGKRSVGNFEVMNVIIVKIRFDCLCF